MSEEGLFSKYISNPVKKFYNYVTGKIEELGGVQNTASDGAMQESSESSASHIQSNENDII
ncbi:hypothetical protein [Wolbachia endosymbiont of Ctenocephalides felis wCfeJ]|uniref:hypothetical protein n=1 Tax=Wolbachia endosymbiont of Ctenocephalides felis wCfeJ TaxID=2732594 RepID=UPI001446E46F|nr:hypothetical protein [Wolbachia endosymbiont of Ctenocephalides felis wCfeJ]WCR58280.1 MAG: hypothetical protein PG980_000752 [Wolbachia endosymbiont of Ctenocephalides felis wCfeJ]